MELIRQIFAVERYSVFDTFNICMLASAYANERYLYSSFLFLVLTILSQIVKFELRNRKEKSDDV